MEDGISEAEAVSDLGPIDEIAAQIAAETPPIPRAIARANTGSRVLNIVLLAVFSPIWVPIALALAATALAVYIAIWTVIAALWAVDTALVLMPLAGVVALTSLASGGYTLSGVFVLGLTFIMGGIGLLTSFGIFWTSKLLFRATRVFARWIAGLFMHVDGKNTVDGASDRAAQNGSASEPDESNACLNESNPADIAFPNDTPIPEEGVRNA